MRWRRAAAPIVLVLALAAAAARADADPGLVVGIADDHFLWYPQQYAAAARDLGATAFRVTLQWDGTSSSLSDADATTIGNVVAATSGLRMIVAIVGQYPDLAPQTDEQRAAYCSYATDLVQRFPQIRDVVVWNEVNLSYFWRPQFDAAGASAAPAAYEALLARCWDQLHAVAPGVNVISDISSRGNDNPNARSNISHSPGNFIAHLASAYRASGRTRPIFDIFGEHPYATSADYPWQAHPGSSELAQGDLSRLLDALAGAFSGTGQKAPGSCSGPGCPTVWYLEAGYQTIPSPDKAGLYNDVETEPSPIPDGPGTAANGSGVPDQGSQIRDGISLAYCQEGVGAFFNFLLADEPDLAGWQSGVEWADGSPKASYGAFQAVAAKVAANAVDCNHLGAGTGTSGSSSAGTSSASRSGGGSSPSSSSSGAGAGPAAVAAPAVVAAATGAAGTAATTTSRTVRVAAPTTALRTAAAYLHTRLHLQGLTRLQAFRSRRNSSWFVVGGFYRRPGAGGAVAVWLQQTGRGVAVKAVARGARAKRARRDVPCDVAYAFVRRAC